MLKGTESILVEKILDDICETREAKDMVRSHWEKIVKAILAHITTHATVHGVTATQIGPQQLNGGKIT